MLPLEELLSVHNKMYYYLQERTQDDDIRSRVRVTASRIQERLQQHGARKLMGQREVVEASTCSCQRHHQRQRNYGKTSSSDSKYSRNCKFSSQLRKHSPWYPSLNNSLCHSPYIRVSCISNRLHSSRAFSITHNSSLSHSTSPLQCLRLLWHLHRCEIF